MVSTPRSVQMSQSAEPISPKKAIGHKEIEQKIQLDQSPFASKSTPN